MEDMLGVLMDTDMGMNIATDILILMTIILSTPMSTLQQGNSLLGEISNYKTFASTTMITNAMTKLTSMPLKSINPRNIQMKSYMKL